MPWEVFDRRQSAPTTQPRLTIQKHGVLTFNRAAYDALGEPKPVELLFDRASNRVGVRSSDPTKRTAYQVRQQGKSQTFNVTAMKFYRYYGIEFTASKRYIAKAEDGVLAVDLDDPLETLS